MSFQDEIQLLLDQITNGPTDLALYRQLRNVSLKHKAAGGRDLGVLAKVKLKFAAADPLQRLVNALRLWSFDAANSAHALSVLQSVENYSHQFPGSDIAAIRRWLMEILTRMNSHSRR